MIKFPKDERVWVSYYIDGEPMFFITSKINNREFYFLYEISNGLVKRLGKAKSPSELENKFDINNKIRGNIKENNIILEKVNIICYNVKIWWG